MFSVILHVNKIKIEPLSAVGKSEWYYAQRFNTHIPRSTTIGSVCIHCIEEEENLFAKWITYKLNQINAKGGLPEEQMLINAGRPTHTVGRLVMRDCTQ